MSRTDEELLEQLPKFMQKIARKRLEKDAEIDADPKKSSRFRNYRKKVQRKHERGPKYSYTSNDFFNTTIVNVIFHLSMYITMGAIIMRTILAIIDAIGWIDLSELADEGTWIILGLFIGGIVQFLPVLAILGIVYLSVRKKRSIQKDQTFEQLEIFKEKFDYVPKITEHSIHAFANMKEICPICKEKILYGEKYFRCMSCQEPFHYEHIIEKIGDDGYCPDCKRNILAKK